MKKIQIIAIAIEKAYLLPPPPVIHGTLEKEKVRII